MSDTIFVLGYPGAMGGANTECWHTVCLWREMGIDVTLIPTWGEDQQWRRKLEAIGARTVNAKPQDLDKVEGLAGSIVVGMCNSNYLDVFGTLKGLGCRTVWVNCMTFLFDQERAVFSQHGCASAYVFQSEFQKTELVPQLRRFAGWEDDRGHMIRGAFAFDEYEFKPRSHRQGEPFFIGKLARPDLDKWSSNHWPIMNAVPYDERRAIVMGWTAGLKRKLGDPPGFAQALAPMEITAAEFLGRCHALVGLNGGARENWPRVGLEAMAVGVPLVCQNQWGWAEMITHGETGYLSSTDREMEYYLAKLAHEEDTRKRIIANARGHVLQLADKDRLAKQWRAAFRVAKRGEVSK